MTLLCGGGGGGGERDPQHLSTTVLLVSRLTIGVGMMIMRAN